MCTGFDSDNVLDHLEATQALGTLIRSVAQGSNTTNAYVGHPRALCMLTTLLANCTSTCHTHPGRHTQHMARVLYVKAALPARV